MSPKRLRQLMVVLHVLTSVGWLTMALAQVTLMSHAMTGIDEDPVTGSAHCALGPFWSDRIGRRKLVGQQLSARGGAVGVEMRGDRVTLTGRAVTVIDGALLARAEG